MVSGTAHRALCMVHQGLVGVVTFVEKKLQIIGGSFLVLMVLITTANIIGRKLGYPIKGTVELVGLFSALVISASLALTQSQGGHIAVNIITEHFPARIQKVLGIVNALICSLFFIILAKALFDLAQTLWQKGEITETLHLALYPFVFFCALGVLVLALSLAVHITAFICGQYHVEYQGDKG